MHDAVVVSCNLSSSPPWSYEGAHDIHALIIGRAIIGIAAFAD